MNAATGALSPTFRADLQQLGQAVAVTGGQVYVGGSFDQLDGRRIDNLGSVSAVDGQLVTGYTPEPVTYAFGAPPTVGELLIAGGRLYAGGSFNAVGTYPQGYLAALPLTTSR
jgi:hypothetical protein